MFYVLAFIAGAVAYHYGRRVFDAAKAKAAATADAIKNLSAQ